MNDPFRIAAALAAVTLILSVYFVGFGGLEMAHISR